MNCPQCQHPNSNGAKFCVECGITLHMLCGQCGHPNAPHHKFCSHCGSPIPASPLSVSTQRVTRVQPRDERRWATLLFADLSGFTALSERLDPEDVKTLANQCAHHLSEEVRRFGGTVIHVAGDQVAAVFGAPIAHEDDAERAVRTALAMRDCTLEAITGHKLQLHIGVNTGDVMTGSIGPAERQDYSAMGDTTNVAARLMSAAPPGCVLIGEETMRAVRQVIRCRELPPIAVKGKERPLAVWEAVDATSLPVSRPQGTAPFIGRDDELAMLSGIWLKVVRESQPHLVTVLGDPGLGKSRLFIEFERRHLQASGALVLHGRCLPYGEALSYWALIAALKEACGITHDTQTEIARVKLEELIHELFPHDHADSDVSQLIRHLTLLTGLEIPSERSQSPVDQNLLRASVRRFFEALARRQPLCVMFEDIHWADDALLELIEAIANRTKDSPLLIIAQSRPQLLEKRPNWGGGMRAYSSLALKPLDDEAGRRLINALCHDRGLPDQIAEQVGRGAGGNPLFAEELVAMIAERGGNSGIPSAIKAIIAARLDTLPADERLAVQYAAIFGKVFWENALRALINRDVAKHLDDLEQKDLLRLQTRSQWRGSREYSFKHDLIRDVAYETLPRSERKVLHGRIADWIEQNAGEHIESYFDELAHHALNAGQEQRALQYLTHAAERACSVSAHRQEAALLAQAIRIAKNLSQTLVESNLHATRGKAFINFSSWPEAKEELHAALQLLSPDPTALRARILANLAAVSFWLFEIDACRQHATECLQIAQKIERQDLAGDAIAWLGACEQSAARMPEADALYRKAIATDPNLSTASLGLFGLKLYLCGQTDEALLIARQACDRARNRLDTSVIMFVQPHLGLALAATGRYTEALQVFEDGRRFGQEHEIKSFLARSVAMSAGFHLDLFDYEGNEALALEAIDLSQSANFLPPFVSAQIDLIINFARREEVARAQELMVPTREKAAEIGGWHEWLWKLRLTEAAAELELARKDWSAAHQWATQALSLAASRFKYQALALWTRSRALAGLGKASEASADLERAFQIARSSGDPALFLRIATALISFKGSDSVLTETRATACEILRSLPTPEMRRRFANSEALQILGHWQSAH